MLSLSFTTSQLHADPLPPLPEAVSHQVTLQTSARGKTYIASFGGQSQQSSAHQKAWLLTLGDSSWQPLPALPSVQGATGRSGSAAVVLDQQFMLFGGTGPGRSGKPITLTDSYRLSPIGKMYQKLPDMPVAVYDAVAQVYRNRYVYLIGGNHQGGQVNLVQVFDNFTQKWSQATPLPTTPLSRHSAVLQDDKLLVCGGEIQQSDQAGAFTPALNPHCFLATLNPQQPAMLTWRQLSVPANAGRLDSSALVLTQANETWLLFTGGVDLTAAPLDSAIGFDLQRQQWQSVQARLSRHHSRYLLRLNDEWYSLGGINSQGQVVADFIKQQINLQPDPAP